MKAHLQVQQHSLPGSRLPVPGSLFAEPGARTAARLRTKSQAVSFLRMHAVPPPTLRARLPDAVPAVSSIVAATMSASNAAQLLSNASGASGGAWPQERVLAGGRLAHPQVLRASAAAAEADTDETTTRPREEGDEVYEVGALPLSTAYWSICRASLDPCIPADDQLAELIV